ncbi:hypothetical protein [Actinacidiphila soli]|nr:hypothetical protein [Actinacidiphila soli]
MKDEQSDWESLLGLGTSTSEISTWALKASVTVSGYHGASAPIRYPT